ncbi:MAG: 3-deoxy-manno-octulosonate cytidylyltransferase [Candidatus Omnitrophica bacterium]|nr:3-deoxy-manno-octulosonate cytidylyltransferase [Candidatus Omnitrophota bacterium]
MGALVVIPARYGSVRFPGKPLAMLAGKPMIQHVYEGAARAKSAEETVVATDDQRIVDAVERFGGRAVLTRPDAASGTERAAEVARTSSAQVIINVQGDEPLVQPRMIDQLAEFLTSHAAVPMASLMTPLSRPEDLANPNVVKVVVDRTGFALYFSRSLIPYRRDDSSSKPQAAGFRPAACSLQPAAYKHLGIYGYQRHFLLQFPSLEPTPLERLEQLEQLRALEHGYRIKLLETEHDSIGVDTPDDLRRVETILGASSIGRERAATRNP